MSIKHNTEACAMQSNVMIKVNELVNLYRLVAHEPSTRRIRTKSLSQSQYGGSQVNRIMVPAARNI